MEGRKERWRERRKGKGRRKGDKNWFIKSYIKIY